MKLEVNIKFYHIIYFFNLKQANDQEVKNYIGDVKMSTVLFKIYKEKHFINTLIIFFNNV